MAYQLTRTTIVRAAPSDDSDFAGVFGSGKVLIATGKKAGQAPDPIWVNVMNPPGRADGWIPLANVREVAGAPRPDVDQESFVRECILAELSFNQLPATAPWFVAADFLIARAIIETDVANPGPAEGSTAVGPLHVSADEWQTFTRSGEPLAAGYSDTDFDYPLMQVYAAAYSMRETARALSAQAAPPAPAPAARDAHLTPVTKADGPFVPSYLDIFLAYLTDVATATRLRTDQADAAAGLSPAQLAAIGARQPFAGLDATTTVSQLTMRATSVLDTALQQAFDRIKTFAPDAIVSANGRQATWMEVAAQEQNAGVSEAMPDRIKEYFLATDFGVVGPADPVPNWCGAFVSYCMKTSGFGSTIPKGAARAANWKAWGQGLPVATRPIPAGAVVVLTPSPGTNTSGHVAFFLHYGQAGKVDLLGGNQRDSVNDTAYPSARIAAIRWLGTPVAGSGSAAGQYNLLAAQVPHQFWRYGDMIVDRFSSAGFSAVHQLAALANAIGESGLDPTIKSAGSEQSFGLFQCNRTYGLGIGYTIDQLQDPEVNIRIVIGECRKHDEFMRAKTVNDAVTAFVTQIERPKDKTGAIKRRLEIAASLQKLASLSA